MRCWVSFVGEAPSPRTMCLVYRVQQSSDSLGDRIRRIDRVVDVRSVRAAMMRRADGVLARVLADVYV